MATVLRAFDYSFDGVTALKALVGAEIDFGDMTAGLVAEGYVAAAVEPSALAVPEPAPVVPEPEEPAVEPVVDEVVTPDPHPVVEPPVEPATVEPKRRRK